MGARMAGRRSPAEERHASALPDSSRQGKPGPGALPEEALEIGARHARDPSLSASADFAVARRLTRLSPRASCLRRERARPRAARSPHPQIQPSTPAFSLEPDESNHSTATASTNTLFPPPAKEPLRSVLFARHARRRFHPSPGWARHITRGLRDVVLRAGEKGARFRVRSRRRPSKSAHATVAPEPLHPCADFAEARPPRPVFRPAGRAVSPQGVRPDPGGSSTHPMPSTPPAVATRSPLRDLDLVGFQLIDDAAQRLNELPFVDTRLLK